MWPETANNAGAGGSFVPLLSLGIPSNVVMALLLVSVGVTYYRKTRLSENDSKKTD